MNDNKTLSHITWNCKYHIVFAPKYRRKVFYESKRLEIGKNTKKIKEYISNQLKEDRLSEQMAIEEINLFKG